MPSKGGSRQSRGLAGSDVGNPSSVVLQSVVGSTPTRTTGFATAVEGVPVGDVPIVDDDPPVDSPAWVELYTAALAQYREHREQREREQEQAQQLWDEFLRLQGEDVPEGEGSLVTN